MSFEFFDLPSDLRDIIYNYVRIYRFQEAKKRLAQCLEERKNKITFNTQSDPEDGSTSYIVNLKINLYKEIVITKYLGSFVNMMVNINEEKVKMFKEVLYDNTLKVILATRGRKTWLYMHTKDSQFNRIKYDRWESYDRNKKKWKCYYLSMEE